MSHFKVNPQSSLIDQSLSIRISSLNSGVPVTVRAELRDDLGQIWSSYAEFVSDAKGTVDLDTAKPKAGTYTEPDPMGLFWSMRLQTRDPKSYISYIPLLSETTQSLKPLSVTLRADVKGDTAASMTIERLFLSAGVERIDIRDESLIAALFVPPGKGPHPAALVVGHSGGGFGWSIQVAALLASRGRAAMSVAYFDWRGRFGLPNELVEIPLEYFGKAIDYLKSEKRVSFDDFVVIGMSKGGELALLLGATYADIRRVVAYVPSSVVWEGARMHQAKPQSSWTYQGKRLPFVTFSADEEFYKTFDKTRLRPFHEAGLRDKTAVEEATIPVEKIAGPILLISATEDSTWPSTEMSDMVIERLKQHRHPYESVHLRLVGAGHYLDFLPYLPANDIEGVEVAINARADQQSWQMVMSFLGLPVN